MEFSSPSSAGKNHYFLYPKGGRNHGLLRTRPYLRQAISAMDKELRQAYRDGLRLHALRESGHLTDQEEQRIRSRYRGTARRLLEAAEQGLVIPGEK